MVQIVPSILSADFARLADDIARVEQAGVSMLHVDVMDGHFVPNITVGPPVVKCLREVTKLTLDVHLMITDPDRYAPLFIEAGADQVSVHQESCLHLDRTLRQIQADGAAAGVVLNPSTPVTMLEDVLEVTDFVLIMSVNPGFGGQRFIEATVDKVRRLRAELSRRGLDAVDIEVDGGITAETARKVVAAGATVLVAGNAVFKAPNYAAAVRGLRA